MKVSLEVAAKAVSDFHTFRNFETSDEEWKQCCRNEAMAVFQSVGIKYDSNQSKDRRSK